MFERARGAGLGTGGAAGSGGNGGMMNRVLDVSVVVGTRPEAIKLAPVILAMARAPERYRVKVISTGQHRAMLDRALGDFGITPDLDLQVMRDRQTLAELSARVMTGVSELLATDRPDLLMVQGDTTTAFIAALCAFYQQVPVVHIEAGLRSHNPLNPFPEEMNRRLIGGVAALHCAPTPRAGRALVAEGVARESIAVTGNTVIDALHTIVDSGKAVVDVPGLPANPECLILVTLHRRESWGEEMSAVCRALRRIVDGHPEVTMVLPAHLNPNVREVVMPVLGGHERIVLVEPVPYPTLVGLIRASHLVITDSGGIQEEAPAFGKPVLVARKTTERPEAVEANCARLVGTDEETLFAAADQLLRDDAAYAAMVRPYSPFGDGQAAQRTLEAMTRWFSGERPALPAAREFAGLA